MALGSLILFMFIGVAVALIVPFITAETYAPNDTPHIQFRVVVHAKDKSSDEHVLKVVRWSEYVDSRSAGNFQVYRSDIEGTCTDTPFWCQAENIAPDKQLIELRHGQENFHLFNRYYVIGDQIQPIYFRITDRGHAVMGVMASFVLTPIILVFSMYIVKRYKRRHNRVDTLANESSRLP